MKKIIEVKNKSIAELVDQDGIINAVKRIKVNDRISFISPDYKIGKGTEIYYFVNIFGKGSIGEFCLIASYVEIQDSVIIGSNCRIGSHSFICSGAEIEDGVFLGSGINTCNDKNPKVNNPNYKQEKIIIRKNAVIGSGTTLLPGIEIGESAVIGAGSVVVKSVPPFEVWVGGSAKPIKRKKKE